MKRKHVESMPWLDAEPAMIIIDNVSYKSRRSFKFKLHDTPRLPTAATGKTKRFSVNGITKFYLQPLESLALQRSSF